MGVDQEFERIVGDAPSQAPARLIVLFDPTEAQVRAIPLGSDVVVTDTRMFLCGIMAVEQQESLIHMMEGRGHLHATVAYLPPPPTSDSVLSPDALAQQVLDKYMPRIMRAADGQVSAKEVAMAMLRETVVLAREGVSSPF